MEPNNTRPSLRVSLSTKTAKDFEYTKSVMDHYIGSSGFLDTIVNSTGDDRDLRVLYLAYNLQLPESYFHYVVNPYNSTQTEYKNWPARLRSYSIIRPNVDLLEGEFEKRPFNFAVKVNNPDAVNIAQDLQYQALLGALEQQFINELNAQGAQTGQPTQEVEPPAKIKAKFVSNYRDERAMMGEAALNILIDDLLLEENFKRLFKDWIIAGEVYSYKYVDRGDVCYERVSPLDIDYDKSPDTEYIEDGQWAVRRMYMTMADIVDHWYDELTAQEIIYLEEESGDYTFRTSGFASTSFDRDDIDLKRSKIEVYHVTWKYLTKIGILTYTNPLTGEPETTEVPEGFKPDPALGESVEWLWVNEVWQGFRVGDSGPYLSIGPIPMQRNKINNFSKCKLPYNGKKFSEVHARNISIVEMGMPYEILHRILHYQMEKTIAKSKGKIVLLDQNVIPKRDGWTEEKFFHWAEANGWGIINRNQVGVDRSYNQYQVLDLDLFQHVANLIEVMQYVKEEWDELVGITRQRKGKTEASETATANNAAIYQSSVISERVFSRFEEFMQHELTGLLDYSKLAWHEGKKRLWLGDDMRSLILDIDPVKYSETEYGVYVSKSPRDLQSLEMVRQQVQAFAQNGMAPSTIVDVVRARSLSKLQQILRDKEAETMENQQKAAQMDNEAIERQIMIKEQYAQLQGLIDERLIHVEYDRKEDIEMLKLTGEDQNVVDIGDPLADRKLQQDGAIKQQEIALKNRSEANKQQNEKVKAAQKDRELDIKERELKVRKEIADKQAKVALKNKVVGEKNKSK